MDKIEYLCKKSPKVEWSGLLFYEVLGSIKNLKKVKLVCKDILLMDIGTAAYTEFDWDEDVVNYRMDNPEAMEWSVGHIHSHNTMNVFFSGTDWAELNDNCRNHNFYLSLIVNNYSETTAKIAFTANPISFMCLDEEGKDYKLNIQKSDSIEPFMFILDCDITKREKEISVPDVFEKRLQEVNVKIENKRKVAEAARAAQAKAFTPAVQSKGGYGKQNTNYLPPNQQHHFPVQQSFFTSDNPFDKGIKKTNDTTEEEDFTMFLLKLGCEAEENETLRGLLYKMKANKISADLLSATISNNYGLYYASFFMNPEDPESANYYDSPDVFLEVLEEVISILESEDENVFTFLPKVIEALEILGNRYEENLSLVPIV